MNYEDAATTLAYDTAFWAMAFEDEHYDVSALGGIALELGHKCRALGILGLLATGEPRHLHENLRRSGEYRLAFLQRVQRAGQTQQHHFVLGRLQPVLDVLAAGDYQTLREIIRNSPSGFRKGHEYVPDHCYVTLLCLLSDNASSEASSELIEQALARYEDWLGGDFDPRFDLCTALAQRDEPAFLEAFHMLLDQHLMQMEEKRATDLEEILLTTDRLIFIEGLALLRLADRIGFSVQQDFSLCPRTAMAGAASAPASGHAP